MKTTGQRTDNTHRYHHWHATKKPGLDRELARTRMQLGQRGAYLPAAFSSVTLDEPGLELISTRRGGDLSRDDWGWVRGGRAPSGLSEWFNINIGIASSPFRPGVQASRRKENQNRKEMLSYEPLGACAMMAEAASRKWCWRHLIYMPELYKAIHSANGLRQCQVQKASRVTKTNQSHNALFIVLTCSWKCRQIKLCNCDKRYQIFDFQCQVTDTLTFWESVVVTENIISCCTILTSLQHCFKLTFWLSIFTAGMQSHLKKRFS